MRIIPANFDDARGRLRAGKLDLAAHNYHRRDCRVAGRIALPPTLATRARCCPSFPEYLVEILNRAHRGLFGSLEFPMSGRNAQREGRKRRREQKARAEHLTKEKRRGQTKRLVPFGTSGYL